MKSSYPTSVQNINFPSFQQWNKEAKPFFFNSLGEIDLIPTANKNLAIKAEKIKNGIFTFFSGIEYDLGKNYDWITNPDNGFKYPNSIHWLSINDFSEASGDIKFVWEKSRFSFLYTLIRDHHHNGNDNGDFIIKEILDWIEKNPVNCGPNWKCSQEISLRVLNWVYALYYYKDQNKIKEVDWQIIMNSIYWQMDHVYKNIHFSRIAVRNNHAITETFTLYFIGTLFPFFKLSEKWKKDGKKWFEREILYQVYTDGTFLQYSMNYHRVLIQLLTWAIGISELNNDSFSFNVKERTYKALNFLFQCQDEISGHLPNYGANDGAIFFPLNDLEYRDYRPQINALHRLLTGKPAYDVSGDWNEDAFWFGNKLYRGIGFQPLKKETGIVKFDIGGFYLFRQNNRFTFIRCGCHPNRPSQADNLHVDIWCNGKNLLVDAGSYKYNTDATNLKYFSGTASHNTIMIGNHDQMLKGARFIWYNWTQSFDVEISENEDYFYFKGKISAFREIGKDIIVVRAMQISKKGLEWIIKDEVLNYSGNQEIHQYWHINNFPEMKVHILPTDTKNIIVSKQLGWYSSLYGIKVKNEQIVCSTKDRKIESKIVIE